MLIGLCQVCYFSFFNDTCAGMQAETEFTTETPYENLGMPNPKLRACLYLVRLPIVPLHYVYSKNPRMTHDW